MNQQKLDISKSSKLLLIPDSSYNQNDYLNSYSDIDKMKKLMDDSTISKMI